MPQAASGGRVPPFGHQASLLPLTGIPLPVLLLPSLRDFILYSAFLAAALPRQSQVVECSVDARTGSADAEALALAVSLL